MSIPSVQLRIYLLLAAALVLIFQNCDGGFQYDPETGLLSSIESPQNDPGRLPFGMMVKNSSGAVVIDGAALEASSTYDLWATGTTVENPILMWSFGETNSADCSLGATGQESHRLLSCEMPGDVQLKLAAVWPDGSFTSVTMDRVVSALAPTPTPTPMPTPTPGGPNGVELYAINCAGCHLDLANSTKKGRNFTQIKDSLVNVPAMQGIILDDAEIQALVNVLNQ